MSERNEAVAGLSESGVLDCIRWAWSSTCMRLVEDYDQATGHDQAWLGFTGHKIFKDRLDRVFRCLDYAAQEPDDEGSGLDVLVGGLFPGEPEALLGLRPAAVEREDVTGSPGWRCGSWHWLLNSFAPGGVRKIDWRAKSPTKQHVANQPSPDYYHLFSEFEERAETKRSTLVVAHSYDGDLGDSELYIGSPTINQNSGSPWNWLVDLRDRPTSSGGSTMPTWPNLPQLPDSDDVADAPVRLKPRKDDRQQKGTT